MCAPDDCEFTLNDPPPTPEQSARHSALTEVQRQHIDALLVESRGHLGIMRYCELRLRDARDSR